MSAEFMSPPLFQPVRPTKGDWIHDLVVNPTPPFGEKAASLAGRP